MLPATLRKVYKAKVCLVGEFAVGKTSLVNRYIHNVFHDRYFATIGAKITKAEVPPRTPGTPHTVMTLWDIMGEKGFRELLKEAYDGAHGALAVCDLTRPETLEELRGWVSALKRIAGDVPVMIVGNKTDLEETIELHETDVAAFAKDLGLPYMITSAKTGENVHAAIRSLAGLLVDVA